jgi:REP element-mobilizing transposase RayT
MSHSYRELFYHLVWSTKYHDPLITDAIKPVLLELLTGKAAALGCRIFAANCVRDHVHLLLYIPPSMAISTAINRLKGASSYELKKQLPNFCWQQGYSIFSLRRSDLPVVQEYIKNQEQHHREGSIHQLWEASAE